MMPRRSRPITRWLLWVCLATGVMIGTAQGASTELNAAKRHQLGHAQDAMWATLLPILMGLYRRKRVWWGSWTDRAGRQHRVSLGTKNKREAKQILETRRAQDIFGQLPFPRARSPKLDEWRDEQLKTISNESTKGRYEDSLNHLVNFLGPIRVSEINALDISRFLRKRLGDGASPATVNRDRLAASWLLNRARKLGFIPRNPCADVDPLNERLTRREAQPLSYEEEQRLLAVCPPLLRIFVVVLIETGLRAKKEALPLAWTDVDLESSPGSITVRRPKTISGQRRVWLTEYCRKELIRWREFLGPKYSPFVFPSLRHPNQHWTYYQDAWEVAAKKAGVRDRRVHDLRATFATRANSSGPSSLTLAQLLGHATTQILPTYAKPLDPNIKAIIESLDTMRSIHVTKSGSVH